jgi:hypothetical protein
LSCDIFGFLQKKWVDEYDLLKAPLATLLVGAIW